MVGSISVTESRVGIYIPFFLTGLGINVFCGWLWMRCALLLLVGSLVLFGWPVFTVLSCPKPVLVFGLPCRRPFYSEVQDFVWT